MCFAAPPLQKSIAAVLLLSAYRRRHTISTSQAMFHTFFMFRTVPLKLQFQYIVGPRNKYVPLAMMLIYIFISDLQESTCTKDEQTAEEVGSLQRPTFPAVLNS